MSTVQLTAYNVKTKEKNVPILDAVISKTAKGAYMAQGNDGGKVTAHNIIGRRKSTCCYQSWHRKTKLVIVS